jgi:L-lactate utilization protein LutB
MDYTQIASQETIDATAAALKERGVEAIVVATKEEALAKIKELIPQGASVMNGASKTLEAVGFIEYLKSGAHGWNNLHAAIVAETDKAKQGALRKQAALSDFYLGSVHALAQTGEFVIASASGSQLAHVVFTSPNLIFVVGTQKIVPALADARARVADYVFPLEDARMKSTGAPGSVLAKEFIFHREPAVMGRKVRMILVNEALGF